MTLGNDPQPLTRRQMRERARAQAPASDVQSPSVESPSEAESGPLEDFAPGRAADERASVFAPRSSAAADDTRDSDDEADDGSSRSTESATVADRTLTRRELRELMAARQAENGVLPDPAVVPHGFVIDDVRDDDVIDDDVPEDVRADALDDEKPTAAPALSLPPQALNPPVGHWSIDRDIEQHTQVLDQNQSFDQLLSRGVAAGGIPTTTNALILPSIPQGNSSGSLTSTGEILITGSIDLPRSLGSTGQHPNHFDSSEMDHMEDQLDEADSNTSVTPVSASRAVSTHTSTRGVMTPPKKRAASLPVILAVTAGVLLVGVLALFAAAYLFHIF